MAKILPNPPPFEEFKVYGPYISPTSGRKLVLFCRSGKWLVVTSSPGGEDWRDIMTTEPEPDPRSLIDAHHCKTCTCRVECQCDGQALKRVEGHPLNTKDWDAPGSRQGYAIMQCSRCGKVWGLRYQWDAGTGSDNRYKDFGWIDPAEIKERHY